MPDSTEIEITFYTKDPCPLCDRLKAMMQPLLEASSRPVRLIEIDISRDPGLLEQYRIRIPVVMCEERILFEGRPNQEEVETALKALLRD